MNDPSIVTIGLDRTVQSVESGGLAMQPEATAGSHCYGHNLYMRGPHKHGTGVGTNPHFTGTG
jgi:hypothetical protein